MAEMQHGKSAAKKPRKNAAARIAALKAAGVDTSNYFPMGEDMIVKVEDGVPTQVTDDDPVFASIAAGGYIAHPRLYRRWVMAQMFRILRDTERHRRDFTAVLQDNGYEYSWKMLERELLAQYKMARHGDSEAFSERNRWFSREVCAAMAKDYIFHLNKLIGGLKTRHCRGREYKRICGTNVFTDEIQSKYLAPIEHAAAAIERANSPWLLHKAVTAFNRVRPSLRWSTRLSKEFVNAYKGAGAYFTMKNLILFHGARFHGHATERQSLCHMERQARVLEGWELLGAMKQLIADSGISVEKKIAEWRKK